ncbi:MAG TPA: LamG-like jellyroll fold domain-containing protein [Thermoguttaceae bacterium]|nr:LamG-like jellyroll fold domain-containing protein [Thermoguttaceae bacterium]
MPLTHRVSRQLGFLSVSTALALLAAAGTGRAEMPADERVIVVSYGDHFVVFEGDAKLDTPEKIERSMRQWRDVHDATTVYWRTGAWFIRNRCTRVPASISKYWTTADDVFARFDPYETACQSAHELGLAIYGYATIFDEGSPPEILYGGNTPFPWQSHFTIEHPEYLVVDREGKKRQYGVMEYAYPEVRRYKLRELTDFLDAYDYDGVYLCTRSHSRPADRADQFGFGEPVVRAYRERYGTDVRTEDFDVEAWRALRGEFLTQFLREVRRELDRRGKKLAVGVPQGDVLGPPYGNVKLDWQTWVREKLLDRLVIGIYSGDWHYPAMRGKDRERGYLASGHERWGLPPVDEALEKTYGPLAKQHGVAVQYALLNAAGVAGTRSYGVVKDTPELAFPGGRFSVEAWIKIAGPQDYGRLVSRYDHTLPDNSGRGWEIYVEETGEVFFRINDGDREYAVKTERRLPVDEWAHLVCVSEGEGGRMKVYVDGTLDDATTGAPATVRRVPVRLFVGRYPTGGRPLEGWLAELRISRGVRRPQGVPRSPLEADGETLVLWQPTRGVDLVADQGSSKADLQLLNVKTWESGPLVGLAAVRLGERPK